MKIGFDAKRALLNGTGLGEYSRNLIQAMLDFYPENELHLYSTAVNDVFESRLQGDFKLQLPSTTFEKTIPSLWRFSGIKNNLRAGRLDVYHGLSNELPMGIDNIKGLKKIVTIHDVLFLTKPEQYPFLDRKIYNFKVRHACKVADVIIATSEQTKAEIVLHYNVSANKIKVVYQNCQPIFNTALETPLLTTIREKYQLPKRYILNVSSFYPRKNQLNLVKAFAQISNTIAQDLVIVGGFESERKIIEEYITQIKLGNRVHILSQLSSTELVGVYQMADLFVYPSIAEGFGIPILEALSSGLTVVASDIDCFKEVGQDAIYYAQTSDVDALKESILFALKNPMDASILNKRANFFDRLKMAEELRKIYRE